ncbi:hypothetical protein T09_11238, partial [Trichinella sp. T9]
MKLPEFVTCGGVFRLSQFLCVMAFYRIVISEFLNSPQWLTLIVHFNSFFNVRLELIPRPENFPINSNRFLALQYANEDRLKIAFSSISNGALDCLSCVASNSYVKRQTFALNMINEEKKKWKRGQHEADRGRHEADRGRQEADRGRHEAEQEKTKFLGPQFCRSGIGILRK